MIHEKDSLNRDLKDDYQLNSFMNSQKNPYAN